LSAPRSDQTHEAYTPESAAAQPPWTTFWAWQESVSFLQLPLQKYENFSENLKQRFALTGYPRRKTNVRHNEKWWRPWRPRSPPILSKL